jgi:transcription antitermination factor NusG
MEVATSLTLPMMTKPTTSWDGSPAGRCLIARWYVAQTIARHEKRAAELLKNRDIENFLPLYESVRRWKDRRVRLHLPLFPGYVFVHMVFQERMRVLEIPSVVRLVGFGGSLSMLPDHEVEALQNGLTRQSHVEPHPYLTIGRRVRVKCGPLEGLEGLLVRKQGRFRLILSVDLIQRSMIVDVDAADVSPATGSPWITSR